MKLNRDTTLSVVVTDEIVARVPPMPERARSVPAGLEPMDPSAAGNRHRSQKVT